MNIEHPPAMHHKLWWHDHCHWAETPGHSTKTTQRHCGQVERRTSNVEWEKMRGKDEHRTSNVQHRMLNERQKQGQEFH